jgi:hypothetical protein
LVAVSYRYAFSQHFRVPPREAFEWCTDYTPADHSLMGLTGRRRFTRLAEDTILLDDVVYSGSRGDRKTKLVKLDPERLTYYNFHLTGPNRNSLFVYEILPDGDGESRLDFSAHKLYYPKRRPTKEQLAAKAQADSASVQEEWKKQT